jgi:hypothetical protein
MKLKRITKTVAVAQLFLLLLLVVNIIRELSELASGHMQWEHNWFYILSLPFYLFSNLAMTVFFFTLANRQKDI